MTREISEILDRCSESEKKANAVFRTFHTIKGVAGVLELKQIGALAHAAETLLDLARNRKMQLVGPRLDVVLQARDLKRQMVLAVKSASKSTQAPVREEGLEPLLDHLNAAARENGKFAIPKEKIAAPKGAAAPESSQGTASIPAAPEQPGSAQQATNARQPTPSPKAPTAQQSSVPPSPSSPAGGDGVVKVATGRLDVLINTVGELVIAQAMVAQGIGSVASDLRSKRWPGSPQGHRIFPGRIQLILIDSNLPNMDGITFVGGIRMTDKKTPLIMVITETEKARVPQAVKPGVNYDALLPFTPDALLEKVKQTLVAKAA
jgi:chemotaxis protein histidine kinase CheA